MLSMFARFLTLGIVLNLIGLLLFTGLISEGIKAENASLIVSFTLFPFAFMGNKNIVFRDRSGDVRTGYRFFVTYSMVVACNYFYLRIVLQMFRIHELIAQVFFLGVVVMGSFLVQKLWVFRLDLKK